MKFYALLPRTRTFRVQLPTRRTDGHFVPSSSIVVRTEFVEPALHEIPKLTK